jgi:hypothetical protein
MRDIDRGGVAGGIGVAGAVEGDAAGLVVIGAAQHRAVAVAELRGGGVPPERGDKGVGQAGAPLQRLLGGEGGRVGLAQQGGRAATVDGDGIAPIGAAAAQVGAGDQRAGAGQAGGELGGEGIDVAAQPALVGEQCRNASARLPPRF